MDEERQYQTHYTNTYSDKLVIDDPMLLTLHVIRFWTNVISIIGFIFLAIFLVVGLFFIFNVSTHPTGNNLTFGTELGLLYLLLVLIGFFPFFYLARFSSFLRNSLMQNDKRLLLAAFESLKAHYKIIGILMILFAAVYAVAIIFSLIGGVSIFMGR